MTRDKYNSIINKVALPLGNQICKETNGFVSWRNGWEDSVFDEYEINRENTHKLMKHTLLGDEDGKIDRHKIGAALLISILNCTPLIANKTRELKIPLLGRIMNEVLSFKTSLEVIVSFCTEDAKFRHLVTPK